MACRPKFHLRINTVFIVIEGIDGTGKATQTALIKAYFESRGESVDTYDFPAYESFVGREVGRLLAGKEDINASTLPAKVMAMLFALDRIQFFDKIKNSLVENNLVISNRYSLSNAAFQSVRCGHDISEWVYELEHSALGLPKPDLYVVLKGTVESSSRNVEKKKNRIYTDEHDLYESDKSLLNNTQELYCTLDTSGVPRAVVNCMVEGEFRSEEDIRDEIVKAIDLIKISQTDLIARSNVRHYVNKMLTNDALELELIKQQVATVDSNHIFALEVLADRFIESELGSRMGIVSGLKLSDFREKISHYLFACVAAKIYISNMIGMPRNIKQHAEAEFCRKLECKPDCIVPMDKYLLGILGV